MLYRSRARRDWSNPLMRVLVPISVEKEMSNPFSNRVTRLRIS